MIKIVNVVGTRPNFIKIAPLIEEMKRRKEIRQVLVHTGQHYDESMSKAFFNDLQIPKPDINLGVGSASDTEQMARIMLGFEKILMTEKPDLVVVVGDVNSTLAAAIGAKKCGVKVAHVEAGLRSFDMRMPEEINRILTDHVSDFLFTTEESANNNLASEGIPKERIFFVGNVMIDTLLKHREKAKKSKILESLGIKKKDYCVLTLHRTSNVDDPLALIRIFGIVKEIQKKTKVIFPVHPRTLKNLKKFSIDKEVKKLNNIILTEPIGYLDFLFLMANSKFVLTDSGGIQEETTMLGIPCITLRDNTERPVTVEQGTNIAVSTDKKKIIRACDSILNGAGAKAKVPKLWDGKSAQRIVDILVK